MSNHADSVVEPDDVAAQPGDSERLVTVLDPVPVEPTNDIEVVSSDAEAPATGVSWQGSAQVESKVSIDMSKAGTVSTVDVQPARINVADGHTAAPIAIDVLAESAMKSRPTEADANEIVGKFSSRPAAQSVTETTAALDERHRELEEELIKIRSELVAFDEWRGKHQNSFSGRFVRRLQLERALANADATRSKGALDSIAIPSAEELSIVSTRFLKRLQLSTLYLIVVGAGLWLLVKVLQAALIGFSDNGFLKAVADEIVSGYTRSAILRTVAWLVGAYVATIVGVFAKYYRDWTGLAYRVDQANAALQYYPKFVIHAESEAERLSALHKQSIGSLQTLAQALRTPYQLPTGLVIDPASEINDNDLPLSVRFGVAVAGNRSQQLKLRRQVLRRLVHGTWRAAAYAELITAVGRALGFDQREFNIDTVDADLAAPSSQRSATLRLNMTDSGALESVGTVMFEELSAKVRDEVIPEVEPPIISMHNDPLDDFSWPTNTSAEATWTKFLHEIFNTDDVGKTPIPSAQTLTINARAQGVINRDNTMSIGLIPAGFNLKESGKSFITDAVETEGQGIVDISVRSDIAGPVDPREITVLSELSLAPVLDSSPAFAADLDEM